MRAPISGEKVAAALSDSAIFDSADWYFRTSPNSTTLLTAWIGDSRLASPRTTTNQIKLYRISRVRLSVWPRLKAHAIFSPVGRKNLREIESQSPLATHVLHPLKAEQLAIRQSG